MEKGLLNPEGSSANDQYLNSIKQDLNEWNDGFRDAQKLYQSLTDLRDLFAQYSNGQVVLNDDEKLHIDLQKLITKHQAKPGGVKGYLDREIKKAKTDRDHNRAGTTRLRLEWKRAQESGKSAKKNKAEIKKISGRYYQYWTSPNTALAAKYQTDRAKPRDVYLQIRYVCVEEPETIEHAKMVKKMKLYKEALPDEPCEEVFKKFIQDRLDMIEKVKHKETYTKGFLLKTVATILSPEDKERVKAFLQTQEHSRSMSYLADAVRMARLQQAHERSGKEGLVSLNVKSKEFQNHFAATQNFYERTRSGFAGVKRFRQNNRQNRQNGQNGQNKKQNNNSGYNSNTNQNKPNNQGQNQNGFTKKNGKKNKKNNNSGQNSNNTQNTNAGRGQGNQNPNNGQCKSTSPTIIPKYDTAKIPAGLSNWADNKVDPRVRQLMLKHFESENIQIKTPPKGTSPK